MNVTNKVLFSRCAIEVTHGRRTGVEYVMVIGKREAQVTVLYTVKCCCFIEKIILRHKYLIYLYQTNTFVFNGISTSYQVNSLLSF